MTSSIICCVKRQKFRELNYTRQGTVRVVYDTFLFCPLSSVWQIQCSNILFNVS